jgi:hypothetical protein
MSAGGGSTLGDFRNIARGTGVPLDDATKQAQATANKEALNEVRDKAMENFKVSSARFRFFWAVRGQLVVVMAGALVGWYFMAYPFFAESFKELFQYHRPMEQANLALPTLSVAWWQNQWRKGVQTWRRGESEPGFYNTPCDWVEKVTGKDLRRPFEAFGFNPAKASDSASRGKTWNLEEAVDDKKFKIKALKRKEDEVEHDALQMRLQERKGTYDPYNFSDQEKPPDVPREDRRAVSKFENDSSRARALVPMCGDSPIVRELAQMGYNVDGVDAVELAIGTNAQKTEIVWGGWNEEPMHRIHLHYSDIFEPSLWRMLPRKGYDLIWDRQGLSAIDPEARDDYAFVLKRAVKPNGLIYTEGCYRTKRVSKNRSNGPPFHFGHKELTNLFPLNEGYMVKCNELKEVQREDLRPEDRVLGQIPKEQQVRFFPCVIYLDEAKAKAEYERLRASAF